MIKKISIIFWARFYLLGVRTAHFFLIKLPRNKFFLGLKMTVDIFGACEILYEERDKKIRKALLKKSSLYELII